MSKRIGANNLRVTRVLGVTYIAVEDIAQTLDDMAANTEDVNPIGAKNMRTVAETLLGAAGYPVAGPSGGRN